MKIFIFINQHLQKLYPLNFAESVTSRGAVPSIADILPLTLWQLQHHCPILPPMKRGSESRLWGVLALQGPGCCCWGGTVRLSKPEKLHGFSPAAVRDGSLSLQVCSSEWGMTAVFYRCPASFFLSHPILSYSSSLCLCLSAALFPLWNEQTTRLFYSPVFSPLSIEHTVQSFLHNHACVSECMSHSLHAKMLHLCVSERVCFACLGGWLVGWLCLQGVSWPGAWNGRGTAWQMAYFKEGFGGSDTVNWGLAPEQELGLLLVFYLLQSLVMDTKTCTQAITNT